MESSSQHATDSLYKCEQNLKLQASTAVFQQCGRMCGNYSRDFLFFFTGFGTASHSHLLPGSETCPLNTRLNKTRTAPHRPLGSRETRACRVYPRGVHSRCEVLLSGSCQDDSDTCATQRRFAPQPPPPAAHLLSAGFVLTRLSPKKPYRAEKAPE